MTTLLPKRSVGDIAMAQRRAEDDTVRQTVETIVRDVQREGESALRRYAQELDNLPDAAPLFLNREQLLGALEELPSDARTRLERIIARVRVFAEAQRACLGDLSVAVDGGTAGHDLVPIDSVGCYAPGGRHPLPSSVIMTVVPARVAGVGSVWVASPNNHPIMLATAALAGADGFLHAGGAQAIAAMAFGMGAMPSNDLVVGPGNAYVTAAKRLLFGRIGIDMLAGPSELVVVVDETSNAPIAAADLLAQAEHAPDALPYLVSLSPSKTLEVQHELARQLQTLPTAETATQALRGGGFFDCENEGEALKVVNRVAPEHLEILIADAVSFANGVKHAGGIFLGEESAEVFGDYGVGPNHVLPTSGGARFAAGLSVSTFLRPRTWLRLETGSEMDLLADDVAWLARQEGLEGHARAAEARRG